MFLKARLGIGLAVVGVLISTVTGNVVHGPSAPGPGCVVIDKNHSPQFISYENTLGSEIKLRVRNNTDCTIVVETDDVLPTQLTRTNNRALGIETVMGSQDGIRLQLHYLVQSRQRQTTKPAYGWGDSVFTYQIPAGQSVIFTVPTILFKRGLDIAVPFNYSWEGHSVGMGVGGVVHHVSFLREDLPRIIPRNRRK